MRLTRLLQAAVGAALVLGCAHPPPLRTTRLEVEKANGRFRPFVRMTTVDGDHVEMMLNTGADLTTLARNNPALATMMRRKGSVGDVVGHTSAGKLLTVNDVPVEFASTTFVVAAAVSPASDTCSDGVIGADILRHCTLVWGWKSLWVACRPQANPR
jgi:hypothetical protein